MTARRNLGDLLADLYEAVEAAREIVRLGRGRWEKERLLRLAGEAVIGRIGDMSSKLPDELLEQTPDAPWENVRGMRIVVDHVYHAVDYNILWETRKADVPTLGAEIDRWLELHPAIARGIDRDRGPDLGL